MPSTVVVEVIHVRVVRSRDVVAEDLESVGESLLVALCVHAEQPEGPPLHLHGRLRGRVEGVLRRAPLVVGHLVLHPGGAPVETVERVGVCLGEGHERLGLRFAHEVVQVEHAGGSADGLKDDGVLRAPGRRDPFHDDRPPELAGRKHEPPAGRHHPHLDLGLGLGAPLAAVGHAPPRGVVERATDAGRAFVVGRTIIVLIHAADLGCGPRSQGGLGPPAGLAGQQGLGAVRGLAVSKERPPGGAGAGVHLGLAKERKRRHCWHYRRP
mmetsp:Transcript_8523/g.19355  ORF Transcript_8523/g.19355 Transcript_8523/m.19355 type:complete len:268 (-) Transcript_8523:135-938(-)